MNKTIEQCFYDTKSRVPLAIQLVVKLRGCADAYIKNPSMLFGIQPTNTLYVPEVYHQQVGDLVSNFLNRKADELEQHIKIVEALDLCKVST